MEIIMKRILWKITLASLITLIAYIALSAVWGAVLSELKDATLKLVIIALMTSAAFGFFLLYTLKIRSSAGENELVADYKDKKYVSLADDLKSVIKRESKTLICIGAIVLTCFALNTLDRVIFDKKFISFPTLFFAPMCLFDSIINIPFVGYALSALIDCTAYIAFLLFYRKRKYNYWMKDMK